MEEDDGPQHQQQGWIGWASNSASSLASRLGLLSIDDEGGAGDDSSRHRARDRSLQQHQNHHHPQQQQPSSRRGGAGHHKHKHRHGSSSGGGKHHHSSLSSGRERVSAASAKNGYLRRQRHPSAGLNSGGDSKGLCFGPDDVGHIAALDGVKKAQMGGDDGPDAIGSPEIAGNLLSILECPVCMMVYKDKVMMCSNGHSICGRCMDSLPDQRCPTCRVKMGNIRNRIVERMLESAALPCVHREYGCKYLGRGPARAKHEETCMFRPIPCLLRRCYPSCKWEGTPASLVDHLNTHCSVRNVEPDTIDDVYWSYKTDKECFQRGKDAAYFLPWCQRFYYVSISKRGELFHLAALWFAISPKAAEEAHRRIKMELVFPLDNQQSVSYSLYPPRLLPGEVLDEQISSLIQSKKSFIVPIRRWRKEWSESKHKCYFQVRARWTDPLMAKPSGVATKAKAESGSETVNTDTKDAAHETQSGSKLLKSKCCGPSRVIRGSGGSENEDSASRHDNPSRVALEDAPSPPDACMRDGDEGVG
eukprot:CAMPEP_0114491790 /NCGR_PEP_ID=MMETSP0109-20121206/3200_1 /TAXON_ID=29199 /ORGANISM="Chlorarachnion reptans, Strain CCCM449" /LENGTH=531 /DNA_ID=CAMNT_0001668571 /DNA_START=204 /DNA_END=1795 /DNA_ORIENTATION=+